MNPMRWRIHFFFLFLQKIKLELLDSRQKVSSLQELSAQLLVSTKPQTVQTQMSEQNHLHGSECLEAQEKVHVIWNRTRLLQREVNSDLEELEKRMEAMDAEKVDGLQTDHPTLMNIIKHFFLYSQDSLPAPVSGSEVTIKCRKRSVM